jgi:hypothetical protein
MGKSPEYIYREEGNPDRLVVFCCDGGMAWSQAWD